MCTLTFIGTKNGYCLTSNRDEKVSRSKATPPKKYEINGKTITFPKDTAAGGTWVSHDEQAILILLNGANEKHISTGNYRKSRGLILLDLIGSDNPIEEWKNIDLENIEPFTIVYFDGENLVQWQWNSIEKTTKEFNKEEPHIWSSATLYEPEIRVERANWFSQFIKEKKDISADELLHFHQFEQATNSDYGLQINRNNILKTVSITQCIWQPNAIEMHYLDLLES
jgi:uncharacterized protein with NRDE domain